MGVKEVLAQGIVNAADSIGWGAEGITKASFGAAFKKNYMKPMLYGAGINAGIRTIQDASEGDFGAIPGDILGGAFSGAMLGGLGAGMWHTSGISKQVTALMQKSQDVNTAQKVMGKPKKGKKK